MSPPVPGRPGPSPPVPSALGTLPRFSIVDLTAPRPPEAGHQVEETEMRSVPEQMDAARMCAVAPRGLREAVEGVLVEAAPEFVGGVLVVALVAAVTWVVRAFGRHDERSSHDRM